MKDYIYRGIPTKRFRWVKSVWESVFPEYFLDDFVIGSLVVDKDKTYICHSGMANDNLSINNGTTTMIEVDPDSVGQYLMCEDKNGRMIFEGDIVRYTEKQSVISKYYYGEKLYIPNRTFTVEMVPSVFTEVYHNCYDLEVIGNIHQEAK